MKVFLCAMIILALLVSGVFFNIHYLTKTLTEIRDDLDAIPIPQEGIKDLTRQEADLSHLQDVWRRRSSYISLTVNHADLMEVETQFAAALGAARAGTRENYLVSLSQLDYALSHLAEMAQASVKNIV